MWKIKLNAKQLKPVNQLQQQKIWEKYPKYSIEFLFDISVQSFRSLFQRISLTNNLCFYMNVLNTNEGKSETSDKQWIK